MALAGDNNHLPWVAGAVLLVAVGFTLDRAFFLMGAHDAQAEILDLRAEDGDCGKGNHECTRFLIDVAFDDGHGERRTSFEVGKAHGYGQPIPALGYEIGATLAVRYTPDNLDENYLADSNDLWRTPLMAWGFGLFLAFAAFARRIKLF